MTIKHLDINDLWRIAAAGGGFRISAKSFPPDDLWRVAAASAGHTSKIVIEDSAALTVNDMWRVATAGKGGIFFE